ncbi:hypothetical protein ACHQM5_011282 [Ranunculus cassubicifolius]
MAEGSSSIRLTTKRKKKLNADRISSLPEPILHHILSYLDMKEVVQTCVIARSWREFWVSVPNLNFCNSLWTLPKKSSKGKCGIDAFVKFVEKVLLFRDNSIIRKFSCSSYWNADQINSWLTVAVNRSIREINLVISPDQLYVLPSKVFTSEVGVFKLKSETRPKDQLQAVQVPESICFAPKLKILHLESVRLSNGNSSGELKLCCPLLEDLILDDCDHGNLNILDISTPQLKNLVIKMWGYCSCKINLRTPNLKSLFLRGYLYEEYSVENVLLSLASARIELPSCPMDLEPLTGILKGLHNVANLEISGFSLEPREIYFEWPQDISMQLLHPFTNLKRLKLVGWNDSSCIHAIADVLKSSVCIETIILEASQVSGTEGFRAELFQHILYCLKSVEIHNIEGSDIELVFLEYILKNAVILETLTITTGESHTWKRSKRELIRFGRKVQSLSSTSSKPIILFILGT